MNINKQQLLIELITTYINKPRIKMNTAMSYYRTQLIGNKQIKPKHFDQLIPYLRFDMKMNEHQLKSTFGDLIGSGSIPVPPDNNNSLEQFFATN